ncbi:DUF1501 domain-containing protein [Hydrogenimonas sp. SS33]|uniref:DUF1501 domain-containing protein n=1 Tax=Hydrogenimonas leucolamina TaxID=2954236 RepID=UPI00336BE1A6
MKRREFLKSAIGIAAAAAVAPGMLRADIIPDDGTSALPLENVAFDAEIFAKNDAQTIVVYLGGGMSDAVSNLNHLPEIRENDLSQIPYGENDFTVTKNGFWQEAGGDILEKMVENGDLTLFRTCYRDHASVAHGINQKRYCHGNDKGYESGIVTTLMHVLLQHGAVNEKSLFPNVCIDGGFYKLLQDFATKEPLPTFMRPISFNRNFDNPYKYKVDDQGQVDLGDYSTNKLFNEVHYSERLDALMLRHNHYDALNTVFKQRHEISDFIEEARTKEIPVEYPKTIDGKKFETAMRILTTNPDTKVVTISGGHSGWDDHSDALPLHRSRAREMFEAIEVAMAHAKAEGRDNINIVLYGDFGRNLNLNRSKGWDHGNNQAVYWFGGKKYLNTLGIVGETELHNWLPKARLYNRPTRDSFQFPAYSIAATIYALYGITNPEVLTGGYGVIDPSTVYTDSPSFIKA